MAKKHRAKATAAARQVWAVLLDSMVISFLGMTCDRVERDARGTKRHARLNQATKKQRTAFQERSVRCLKKCIWGTRGLGHAPESSSRLSDNDGHAQASFNFDRVFELAFCLRCRALVRDSVPLILHVFAVRCKNFFKICRIMNFYAQLAAGRLPNSCQTQFLVVVTRRLA